MVDRTNIRSRSTAFGGVKTKSRCLQRQMMGSVVSPVKISVEIRYRWHMAVPLDKYIKRCEANGPTAPRTVSQAPACDRPARRSCKDFRTEKKCSDGSVPQRVFLEPSREPQLAYPFRKSRPILWSNTPHFDDATIRVNNSRAASDKNISFIPVIRRIEITIILMID